MVGTLGSLMLSPSPIKCFYSLSNITKYKVMGHKLNLLLYGLVYEHKSNFFFFQVI